MLIKVISDIYELYEEKNKVEKQATFLSGKGTYHMNLILNLSTFVARIMNWHTLLGSNKRLTAVRGEGVGRWGEEIK